MHIDLLVALAGLVVGFTVGLTGMGGGALMTPILVLLFRVQPLAAVSSDLVAAVVMKPVGGGVHLRRKTVNLDLVKWLAVGSVPGAFGGVLVLKAMGNGQQIEGRLKVILGVALLVAATMMVVKAVMHARRLERHQALVGGGRAPATRADVRVKPLPTLLIGAVGGLVVGMTSVGSGSLIIVMLLMAYPMLTASQLVGTDLVQAIPLVAAAALGHLLFGDFRLSLTTSLLVGSIPGVYLGARLSARAPDGLIRPVLVFVLVASGLKLVDLSTVALGWTMLAVLVLGLPAWALIDAARRPAPLWADAGISRRFWVWLMAAGAPFGVAMVAAPVYFGRVKPKLTAASDLIVFAETPAGAGSARVG